ncbi:MAG: riboflavin biosynthesis protein RibF [Candidatus Omnitrophota bacterium]
MKIYRSIGSVKRIPQGSVVTLGIFDGVHTGHAKIVGSLVKRAKKLGKKSVILTFHPHPSAILHPKRAVLLLTSLDHRLRLLEKQGVDVAVLLKFSERFSKTEPETFVKDFLLKRLGMVEIFAGRNFVFGRDRKGGMKLLNGLSVKYGFKVRRKRLLRKRERAISSTHIRSLIIRGKLHEAARLLGRPVSILGTVREGSKRGRILGYPTANIDPHHEAVPPSGVYVIRAKLVRAYRCYNGILNIGVRPTFGPADSPLYPPEPTIEAHLFNFNRDIYGKDIEIIFVKRLRPEKRFADKEGLKRRIYLDEKQARRILGCS